MALKFETANSTYLQRDWTPIDAYPLTMGGWAMVLSKPAIQNTTYVLENAANNAWVEFLCNDLHYWTYSCGNSLCQIAAAATVGEWYFVLGRSVDATSHWLATLSASGQFGAASSSNSSPVPAITKTYFGREGGGYYGDIILAEFWLAAADPNIVNAATDLSVVKQLAYEGPFSIPHLASNIIEYQSFRGGLDGLDDRDVFDYHRRTPPEWTISASAPTPAPHPPLSPTYRRGYRQRNSGLYVPM